MIIKYIYNILFPFLIILISSGCSTGIEGTKTITFSKSEKNELLNYPEEKYFSDILPDSLKAWKPGKRFICSDERISYIFEASSFTDGNNNKSLKGRILEYKGMGTVSSPGGTKKATIIFNDGTSDFVYPTGRSTEDALSSITSLDIPMLIDLELVYNYRQRMMGKKFWTRSKLWYDMNGEKINGRKFVPVTISNVLPGDNQFLLRLEITDETGEAAVLYMNPSHRGLESRTFPSVFYLNDPKEKYPDIKPEIWSVICNGLIVEGMTKEECKLSLGNPDDVASGHDWNQTIDIWNYNNGATLQFQDGLLTKFRI